MDERRSARADEVAEVTPERRFTTSNPCPICGGGKDDPQGQGVRCFGFVTSNGRGVICTRDESDREAGDSVGWYHRLPQREEAVYPYCDEDGEVLYEVVRFTPKEFKQRTPDGTWGIRGVRRVLYRLPLVLSASREGKVVYVVEGEKDVHAIESANGVATCNAMGAGKWRDEYSESLRGARVVIVADRDEEGRKHARVVSQALVGIAASVRVVEAVEGKDASDHLVAGHTLDDFRAVEVDELPPTQGIEVGGDFVLDVPETVPAVWGMSHDVLWSEGEPLMIVGTDGTGKGTLVQQLVFARIGVLPAEVLGYPITPSDAPVLYLALDRKMQIRRSMRRMVEEGNRGVLNERLKVWSQPPPFDLVKHPEKFAEWLHDLGAETCVIDSLGVFVGHLSDEETGQAANASFQFCVNSGIQISVLHHNRKPKQGASQEIKDVAEIYGSRWLTSGMGSILSLSPKHRTPHHLEVTLRHLKTPDGRVSEGIVKHDFKSGLSSFDQVAVRREREEQAQDDKQMLADAVATLEREGTLSQKKLSDTLRAMGHRRGQTVFIGKFEEWCRGSTPITRTQNGKGWNYHLMNAQDKALFS